MRKLILTTTASLLVIVPTYASAQETPAEETPTVSPGPAPAAPTGKIHLVAQDPPLNTPRTYHQHDGFYLRTSFGYGATWAHFNDTGRNNLDLDASGSGIAFDLLIGGTPSPGLALGGGSIANWLFSAEFETDEEVPVEDRTVNSAIIGVFVDGFPRVSGGFHLGGLVGLSLLTLSDGGHPDDTAGFGGAAWVGYDQWVADDWSLGGLLRFTAAQTVGEDAPFDVTASQANLTLMFSALYH